MDKIITIDGIGYIEKQESELPFGNACRHCAFYKTKCYDRDDFSCHSDARPDGQGVVFVDVHPAKKIWKLKHMVYELPKDGWIRLWRKLLKKRAWVESGPKHKTILITILLMVNFEKKDTFWNGKAVSLNPGSMITSLEDIRDAAGKDISIQNVRSGLERFDTRYEFLKQEATNTGRLITILNWKEYQHDGQTNQQTEKEIENAGKLYDFYVKKVQPEKKVRGIAIHNILHHAKKYSFKDMAVAVSNYDTIAKRYEPEFRKRPSNFFGINEPYFKDFLPGIFIPKKNVPEGRALPDMLTPEKLRELNA